MIGVLLPKMIHWTQKQNVFVKNMIVGLFLHITYHEDDIHVLLFLLIPVDFGIDPPLTFRHFLSSPRPHRQHPLFLFIPPYQNSYSPVLQPRLLWTLSVIICSVLVICFLCKYARHSPVLIKVHRVTRYVLWYLVRFIALSTWIYKLYDPLR